MPRSRAARVSFLFFLFVLVGVFAVHVIHAANRNEQIASGGSTRTFHVYLPSGYSTEKRWPLVFVIHGAGGQGPGMERLAHYDNFADANGIIAVYPDGIARGWNDGRMTRRIQRADVDDVAFFSAMLDKLESEYSVDAARVYATGISNGGFMSFRLGCDLAARFAAVAPDAATLSVNLSTSCNMARPVPLLMMNGTLDPLVPYEGGEVVGGGGEILSAAASAKAWARMNKCSPDAHVETISPKAAEGLTTRTTAYDGCAGAATVILYTIVGGGHTWPGGMQYLPAAVIGKTSREFDANEVTWKFFEAHPLTAAR
jgi:polyhydroxybutyrate depolymerase